MSKHEQAISEAAAEAAQWCYRYGLEPRYVGCRATVRGTLLRLEVDAGQYSLGTLLDWMRVIDGDELPDTFDLSEALRTAIGEQVDRLNGKPVTRPRAKLRLVKGKAA
jgi:hypothetical protein